ncbi:MAG: glucose-6-phosphate dehydrogenase, partial [bacterium]|nr:glucose-6-phosphate dehydrogenase [bacterium]
MERPDNCIITIFGASGDLTKRKLMPALFDLYRKGLLPEDFAILGIGRTDYQDDSFRDRMNQAVNDFANGTPVEKSELVDFLTHVYYHAMDSGKPGDYPGFKRKLTELDDRFGAHGNTIFYLATTPALYQVIASNLGEQGLNQAADGAGWKRIVFEKPFGFDLESAKELNQHLQQIFHEEQIYRIDHYLGKETVQNILAFRFANGIFEPLWNRNYIHHVEVTAAESIGVEDRGNYY